MELSQHPLGPEGARLRVVEPNAGAFTGLSVLRVTGAAKIERVTTEAGVSGGIDRIKARSGTRARC